MEDGKLSQGHVDAVQSKLQALFEDLPDEQKPVLEALLTHAADGARRAVGPVHGDERAIIIVGGKTGRMTVPLEPGVTASSKAHPGPADPPTDSLDLSRFGLGED